MRRARKPGKGGWRVYLLRCSDNSLYCGVTNDLAARLVKHNQGQGAKYTRSRRPIKLAYVETVKTRSVALRREHQIKRFSKEKKEQLCRRGARRAARTKKLVS